MKKLYNRENLDQLISMVNVDLLSAVQNVEYREEIKETLVSSIDRKIAQISNKYNDIRCLDLVNDFLYLHNEYYSINYDIWSDTEILTDKNGEPYMWKYNPYAVVFTINKGNETWFTVSHGIKKHDFVELNHRYVPRKPNLSY
jgi:hypothetical protein